MTDGIGSAENDPWLAADALREIGEARRTAVAAGRPSLWPRVVQALTLSAPVAVCAGPATAWTPYLIIAVSVLGLGLTQRTARRRVQLNGFWTRGHGRVRAGAAGALLAVIVLSTFGRYLWQWPFWTPLAGAVVVAALFYGASRWFDLRMWRDWGGR